MTPGDSNIVSQRVPIATSQSLTVEHLAATLNPAFVAEVGRDLVDEDRVEFRTALGLKDPRIHHILLALRVAVREGYPAGRLYGESLATALTAHLLRRYSIAVPRVADHGLRLPAASLRRVTNYIHAHLDRDISLRQLGSLVQLSPFHFARLFKQATGLPPHRYLLQQRITEAKRLLAQNSLAIAAIGHALGFPNQAHFTTMFRKMVGMTPGAYRRERSR